MIRALSKSDIHGLNCLPPLDWEFDFESFIHTFIDTDYFYAFVMLEQEKIIGTGNIFFKGSVGWLANIIIDPDFRGQGFGFKMTQFLVDFLKQKGCKTQLLIATDLGVPVYQKIGFKKISNYRGFVSLEDHENVEKDSIRALSNSVRNDVYRLDLEINGENRRHLIDKYYSTGQGVFNAGNELVGFYLPDFGRGIVLSKDEEAGIELLKLKHLKKGHKTMLPVENKVGINFFEGSGLKESSQLYRMILGKENNWKPECVYSYGSGYSG